MADASPPSRPIMRVASYDSEMDKELMEATHYEMSSRCWYLEHP